jgi:ABC-type molybdenum transport system ATPase subunit/photorepair protein PhrA
MELGNELQITGDRGSGKSTILRIIKKALYDEDFKFIDAKSHVGVCEGIVIESIHQREQRRGQFDMDAYKL